MNEKQSHLLKLLKEIDSFCREHDITYYCSGGTVLGAVRHGGFIPWDDDIDMFIPRREFDRLIEAFRREGPADRTIEFYEGNHDHHSTVARYHEEGTSMLMHYNMTGYASAGILIDIFVMDPIPAGYELQREHVAKFMAYADLITPVMSFSHRQPAEYMDIADRYEAEAAERGTDTVAMELSRELFSYDEDECDYYVLRWGSLPFVMPKELFGTPLYVPFEDMMIPIPSQWPRYLAVQYGCTWTDIPYVDNRAQHNTIYRTDSDYHELYELRDQLFDQQELTKLYSVRKKRYRDLCRTEHKVSDFAAEQQIRLCMLEVQRGLSEAGAASAEDLFAAGEYSRICDIYAPYVRLQTHPLFMGALMHGIYYHWYFPYIIPVDENTLSCILWSLIYTGNLRPAEKIAGIYTRANKPTSATDAVIRLFDQLEEAARLYYLGKYPETLSYICGIDGYESVPALMGYYYLAAARTGLDPETASALEQLACGDDKDHFTVKAWADHLWETGKRDDAERIYRELFRTCRNGMFLKDIRDKGVSVDNISLDLPKVRRETDITRCQKRLLDELDAICSGEDISYAIISDHLSADPCIAVTAESAVRLAQAMKKQLPSGRKLLSWGSGDICSGFCMNYIDTATTRIDLKHPGDWSDQCIGIRIDIVPARGKSRIRRKIAGSLETLVKVMDSDPIAGGRYKSGAKGTVYRMLSSLSGKQQQRLRRSAFNAKISAAGKGHQLPVNTDGSKDVPAPKPSVFIMSSAAVSAGELFDAQTISAYESLPWKKYGRLRSTVRNYDNKVMGNWMKMLREAGVDASGDPDDSEG